MTAQGIIDEEALNIFPDGSSFPLEKRAAGVGIRFVWVNEDGHEETNDYSPPGYQSATSDEAEIKSVAVALAEARRLFDDLSKFSRILVFSDCQYVVDNFTNAMHVWPKRKWRRANGMPADNIDLWKTLRKEVQACPLRVSIKWVKGHKKSVHNLAADRLARQSASVPLNPPFKVRATTRKWSDRTTVRGCIPVKGQLLKVRIISREYLRTAKIEEFRYEVIDSDDPNFKDIDFAFCETQLSRNGCYTVRLNGSASRPMFVEVIEELDSDEYRYV